MVAAATQDQETKPLAPQRNGAIPLGLKLKAQNLFINKGYTPKQVAEITGLSSQQISSMAVRGRWVKSRNARLAAINERIEARSGQTISAISEAIADECDEHSLAALDRTGKALARDDQHAAKDAQAFSATLRNLVTVSRAIRAGSSDVSSQGSTQVNLFFFRPTESKGERRAESVDVAATVLPATLPPATT